ncbi:MULTISPECIES: pyridoxal phosphate-dependent decarboxylase family protein [Providencia]|uniref:Pyridoxal-dependent decarboxylase n=1 Tax=Providencia huaxiensis TaxID=2027290 RepID=A0ABU2IYM0_9GAMM|nr:MULTISPECIES: pyridoxal-dependent decarboxylase [Providencia]MBZ3680443.1 tyrosine decarboxylase [Providencia rettgeri]AXH64706.1 tyrosine decarboxylase [Providencia huaxiensis]MDT0133874.1 pyridoxal-dependent decarboxylase [Providencia huaxiensis]MDT1980280.1 pyridoxal-dependent decarboxylase [Providencia huaxiensis]QLR03078.1 tyrosine decarboxylase [Providencia rettgeri]
MNNFKNSKINVDALFLGPKSENAVFFKEMMEYSVSEHMHWRSSYHPEDPDLISTVDRYAPEYRDTLYRTEGILNQLSSKLKTTSVPWFSPRYMGHMNADTLMISNLAYVMAMMYNPNNCAQESSPTTTVLEIEAGLDLCAMFGYDVQHAWGHITSGGTVANYEGLWVARNIKTLPLAIMQHPQSKYLLQGKTEKELLNLSVSKVLDLIDELKKMHIFEEIRDLTCRGVGIKQGKLGKLLVPQSKHYSWMKAMDILGLGQQNIVQLPVDASYRTDVHKMRETVFALIEQGEPILAVVAVVGTTETGAIDNVKEVIELRRECEQRFGISFYVHIDAAYAGYACAMFRDEENQFMEYENLLQRYHSEGIFPENMVWPKRDVYESFKALSQADSITVDPHKVGFIPYAAGAICMKDKRIVDLVSYHAAYVFEEVQEKQRTTEKAQNVLLGSSIMEGSKAGATAAAVWAAHRLVPLNILGYGKVIAAGVTTANWMIDKINQCEPFIIEDRQFSIIAMPTPDFHMINFMFREIGNTSLEKQNQLNKRLYELCSYAAGRSYSNDFLTSSTSLTHEEYGDNPLSLCRDAQFSDSEWHKVRSIYVLRAAIMTHCLRDRAHFETYWMELKNIFEDKLQHLINEENKLNHSNYKIKI